MLALGGFFRQQSQQMLLFAFGQLTREYRNQGVRAGQQRHRVLALNHVGQVVVRENGQVTRGLVQLMKTVAAKGDGHFRHAFGVLLFQRAAEGVQHPRTVAHHHHV